jgi:uroporphyrin-III C-methyltransferase / precorrin-2 dehydrogenase / sirohydrochlorin ferrochelatase
VSEPLFPVFLKLAGRAVLVVGGGKVAAAKLPGLVAAGARITVVAPEIQAEIRDAEVEVRERPFAPEDVDGVWLVLAAAPPEVNAAVAAAAEERRVFVNAVDDAARASAYTGGVLRRDGVTVAVSTEGRAPALAGLLREGLDALVPQEIEEWIEQAVLLKARQRAARVAMEARRPALLDALNRLYAGKAAS